MERDIVWVSSSTQGWALGTITQVTGDNIVVQTEDGETVKSNRKDVLNFQDFHKSDVEDMITMQEAHEAVILYDLNQRFLKDKIYTYIGPVIISINPFKDVKNTGDSVINQYLTTPVDQLPPHLYAIAQNAYNSLVTRGESQSIVISGESGAGKTEATKVILKFLTVACGQTGTGPRHTQELSQRILATNPVLEAFGNAKTVRNNNSSRFGKFISIAFDPGGELNSASINNYLLETIRVVTQAPTERNYHVFYQLLVGSSAQEKSTYKLLSDPAKYAYLKNGYIVVDGIDDKAWFVTLKQSLLTLGISESEQKDIFTLLSGILHLGNVDFIGQDTVKIKDATQIELLCSLFNVHHDYLNSALTQRLFTGGNRATLYNIPLTYSQALENRDALAKAMYSQLFDYLVQRINKPLLGDNPPIDLNNDLRKFIGVLDIYGFEVFQSNSMEQFCINYANEKLHAQFNQHMFKAEQNMYTQEGVPWETVKFIDNQDCIDLIENSGGILSMLDEEGRVPKGADKTLLEKLIRKHSRNPRFKFNPRFPMLFGIDHYAGTVEYDIQNFIQKNKDTLNKDLLQVMANSESKFMQTLFGEDLPAANQKVVPTRSKLTVCGRFQQSLSSLVQILASSSRHYVRCIKPNDKAQPLLYSSLKVLLQLKSNGIFETIRMRKAGFAAHIAFDAFYKRFNFLNLKNGSSDSIKAFLRDTFSDSTQWVLGKTKVFLKDKATEQLEVLRREIYVKAIVNIQSRIRAYYVGQRLAILKEQKARYERGILITQRFIRCWNAKQKLNMLYELLLRRIRSIITFQRYIRMLNARIIFQSLLLERQERERQERERQEKIRLEKERLEKERLEKERLENLRLEKERQEKERQEKDRLDKERSEKERLEKERLEKERLEKDRLEKERLEKERLEKERLEKERQEKERQEKERQLRLKEETQKEKQAREEAQKKQQLEMEILAKEEEAHIKQQLEIEKFAREEALKKQQNERKSEADVLAHRDSGKQKDDDKRVTRTKEEPERKHSDSETVIRDSSVRRKRDEYRKICVVIIQRHIRTWLCKRFAIGLILLRIDELRELQHEQEQEREEWRLRRLQATKDKHKVDRKLLPSSLQQISIIEEQGENAPSRSPSVSKHFDGRNEHDKERKKSRTDLYLGGQRNSHVPKYYGPIWEYSSADGIKWEKFDDFTQDIIEKSYCTGDKEIVLSHGFYGKDQYTVIFKVSLGFRNNKTGNVRSLRRGGKEMYRTWFKMPSNPNLYVKDPKIRLNTNYRAQRKIQRKASIIANVENFVTNAFSVVYSPEVYLLPPEAVSFSENGYCHYSPPRDSFDRNSSPSPRDRSLVVLSPRDRGRTSPRDRMNGLMSPRGKYELDLDGSSPSIERSKSRRKFFQNDRSPINEKSGEMNKMSNKTFTPGSAANKLKYPFRQVSRLWGSQRLRNTGGNSKASKKNTKLANIFDGISSTPEETTPLPRRKIRSRSVPNLEALMALADQNDDVIQPRIGITSARSTNVGGHTSRTRFAPSDFRRDRN